MARIPGATTRRIRIARRHFSDMSDSPRGKPRGFFSSVRWMMTLGVHGGAHGSIHSISVPEIAPRGAAGRVLAAVTQRPEYRRDCPTDGMVGGTGSRRHDAGTHAVARRPAGIGAQALASQMTLR